MFDYYWRINLLNLENFIKTSEKVCLFGLFLCLSFFGDFYAYSQDKKTDKVAETKVKGKFKVKAKEKEKSKDSSLSSTLQQVKKNGLLKCGVSQGLPGFSNADEKGHWTGIDVDFCRAIAAAIFKDVTKVKFSPLSPKERFTALQSGEVDLLSRNTTVTFSRDTTLGFDFTGVTYYDGQGFMVPKKLKIDSVKDLSGATICVQTGTTTELNLADHFTANGYKYKMVAFETNDETVKAYDSGRCDALTTDQSGLYAIKLKLKSAKDHVVLDELISKEPLGPAVRHGDNKWADIVRWTFYAMVEAEEFGITAKNIDTFKKTSKNPAIKRLLGVDGELGKKLGLDKDWSYQVIKLLGNYGEVFDKNLGMSSPLKISRGYNELWTKGGLQYAMPLR